MVDNSIDISIDIIRKFKFPKYDLILSRFHETLINLNDVLYFKVDSFYLYRFLIQKQKKIFFFFDNVENKKCFSLENILTESTKLTT